VIFPRDKIASNIDTKTIVDLQSHKSYPQSASLKPRMVEFEELLRKRT